MEDRPEDGPKNRPKKRREGGPGDGPERAGRVNDPEFWSELQATFENAVALLRELAESQGIDPSEADPAILAAREEELDREVRDHPLARSAAEYARRANRWFRRSRGRIQDWGREAVRAAELNAITPQLEDDVRSMQEAVEEIAEQRHRVQVKIMRALRDRIRRQRSWPASPEADDAAARAAYAGVGQSIDMWLRLRQFFPEEEDAILNLLVHLENLRQALAAEFPSIVPEKSSGGV